MEDAGESLRQKLQLPRINMRQMLKPRRAINQGANGAAFVYLLGKGGGAMINNSQLQLHRDGEMESA